MQTKIGELMQSGWTLAIALGIKVLEAIVLWIVGRWLIGLALRMIGGAMTKQKIDPTVIRYIQNAVAALLNIILVIALLGFFGVQTTSLAALIANFAAGVFMVILQPLKVGDFVTAGGVTGTVHEIGLFASSFDTLDNVRNIIGNAKIFGDVIQNFSTNPYRRVELTAQLAHNVDVHAAMALLKKALAGIPNVMTNPAPDVEILTFNLAGPVLAVRPYCNNKDYWQVYFDTNRLIKETFTTAGFAVPEQHYMIRGVGAGEGAGMVHSA
jgi:small conductance mechanosensitive channel